MQNETHREQSTLPDEETIRKEGVMHPIARRMPYKTVLAAVVIGIIVISLLWLLVIRNEGNPSINPMLTEPDLQTQADAEASGLKLTRSEDEYGAIDRRLVSMLDQYDRGLQAQQTNNSDVKRELTVMTEGLKELKVLISGLGKSNKEIGRHVSETTAQLKTIAKEVIALKVVKRKPITKPKARPAKIPPFHIDAIDVWDDVTYVVVSQAGRVAFLKQGERQSGWMITHIDRLKGQVEIQGPAGQAHSVSLQR
jgi:hypothetical protein